MDHCLKSTNYVNVIVADKQPHLQYLDMDSAIAHCTKGVGIWEWASTCADEEPDVVMASCGDVVTKEALAATALLRRYLPDLKIRFVNVVDLFKLTSHEHHPHGLTDHQFDSIFTDNKPVIFNFHSYPFLVHRLTYKRKGAANIHVRGYNEKGNIDTPLELAIRNGTDRFSLAMEAIDRMPNLKNKASMVREKLVNEQISAQNYAFKHGIDPADLRDFKWSYGSFDGKAGSDVKNISNKVGKGAQPEPHAAVIGASD
jgi:xylulose-5-phosphate/fructose-6-phosphate phosphoketolase